MPFPSSVLEGVPSSSEGVSSTSERVPFSSLGDLSLPNHTSDVSVPLPSWDPLLLPIGSPVSSLVPFYHSSRPHVASDCFNPSACLSVKDVSPIKHHCPTLDVKQPIEGLNHSYGGSTKKIFLQKSPDHDKAPKVPGECLSHAYKTGLTWSKMT